MKSVRYDISTAEWGLIVGEWIIVNGSIIIMIVIKWDRGWVRRGFWRTCWRTEQRGSGIGRDQRTAQHSISLSTILWFFVSLEETRQPLWNNGFFHSTENNNSHSSPPHGHSLALKILCSPTRSIPTLSVFLPMEKFKPERHKFQHQGMQESIYLWTTAHEMIRITPTTEELVVAGELYINIITIVLIMIMLIRQHDIRMGTNIGRNRHVYHTSPRN